MTVILHSNNFWTSPYAFACFVALREKAITFEVREVDLERQEQRSADYSARTLTARVPALDHDGFVLTESMAILEYIEEAFPGAPPMLPREPKERARARQLLSWIRSDDTLPIREERSSEKIFYPETRRSNAPLSDGSLRATAKLSLLADALIPRGKTQLFEAFSVADADLAFFAQRLITSGDLVSENLRALAEAQWKRPSVAEWCNRRRPPFVPY